jgi:serine/threonine protein kinase
VTVTVFPPLSEGRTREGFDRAAATAQRLGAHPSVLTIHEWGHAADGRPWVVTDPQPADSVDTLLTMDGPLEIERALQVGVLLAGALETAHRAGIVHGDLSPARLVFGAQGEPLLAETGLAAFAVLPGLGALNNPVRYHAPPEVLERTEIGPATDVYSLATTVYALLAGRAPQQKPAAVTDSNASLLLRILQMPVPPIDRPDLPPGLEAALRGPLSANPAARPPQAIDVAWLLQDVQRRAGYAVTEPVVLELGALDAGGQPARARAAATTRGAAQAGPAASAHAPAPAPRSPTDEPAPADPWASPAAPAADAAWPASAPSAPAPPGPASPPAEPLPEPFAEPDLPPPTIFPFADGLHAPRGEGAGAGTPSEVWPPAGRAPESAGAAPPTPADEPVWPSTSPADAPADALWPSTWPADQQPTETPAWASPPANGDAAPPSDPPQPAPGAVLGDDGGSIGDAAPLPLGDGGGPAPPMFGSSERPPELDQLPAWYTDPLPNAADRSVANGNGNGKVPGRGTAHDAWPSPPAGPPRPARGQERLPGAGDELRSLFGEVVRDPDDPELPGLGAIHQGSNVPPAPDPDPLGPPSDRPPIDLSQLDAPLGPAAFLPPSTRRPSTADDAGQPPQARLPRRHEVQRLHGGDTQSGGGMPRLPRAGDASSGLAARDLRARMPATGRAPRLERPAPRQIAPAAGGGAGAKPAAMTGPPALPLLVLIGVVAVLVLGVVWLVITGDDAEPPASDQPSADAGAGAGADTGTDAPTGVQATQVPEGINVTWTGPDDASYVVTVLSADQPPRALPPTIGTSVLVPNVELGSGGGRCFTVAAAAGPDAPPGPSSDPACTPGASIEGMQAA